MTNLAPLLSASITATARPPSVLKETTQELLRWFRRQEQELYIDRRRLQHHDRRDALAKLLRHSMDAGARSLKRWQRFLEHRCIRCLRRKGLLLQGECPKCACEAADEGEEGS